MKRLIKFRGKRTDTGEWIYGDLLTSNGTECEISDWNDVVYSRYDVDPDTVGQFIGLLDDNKREVYDGDIIKDSEDRIGQVCWDDEFLQWFIMYGDDNVERCMIGFSCEVIGNVFDNPELLKEVPMSDFAWFWSTCIAQLLFLIVVIFQSSFQENECIWKKDWNYSRRYKAREKGC